jgi:hypothetical protein
MSPRVALHGREEKELGIKIVRIPIAEPITPSSIAAGTAFFEPRGFTFFGEFLQIYIRKNNGAVIHRRYDNLPRLHRNAA